MSFERSHFGEDVVYNPGNESITIYKVPPNLKEQLLALSQETPYQAINNPLVNSVSENNIAAPIETTTLVAEDSTEQ